MTVWWLARGIDQLPTTGDWLSTAERERAARMRFTKRRSEYLLARYTAKHAIAHVLDRPREDADLAHIEVGHRPTGAPVAHVGERPSGLAISLTDRADWAVCAVASADSEGIGCDLELVEARSAAFVRDYLTPDEQELVRRSTDPDLVANLLWSAKESALKVLETGLRRDTRSVEVDLGDRDPAATTDTWRGLTVAPVEGGDFTGFWRRFGPFLLTIVAAGDPGPPRAIEQPSGLETARPSHAWMQAPGPT